MVDSLVAPHWGPGPNPAMCPDWKLNRGPLGSKASAQSTEPHQPGLIPIFESIVSTRTILPSAQLDRGHVMTVLLMATCSVMCQVMFEAQ